MEPSKIWDEALWKSKKWIESKVHKENASIFKLQLLLLVFYCPATTKQQQQQQQQQQKHTHTQTKQKKLPH